ncbi:Hypothetical protein SMAX5B_005774 [Scophthalmus maximus]|nr:Hypothetical protein SMAX5B_005774 [Scophthalmus maximus]
MRSRSRARDASVRPHAVHHTSDLRPLATEPPFRMSHRRASETQTHKSSRGQRPAASVHCPNDNNYSTSDRRVGTRERAIPWRGGDARSSSQ